MNGDTHAQQQNNHNDSKMTEELECVLCLKLLYEPVTTPCGHTFCRTCLFRALDHSQGCPLCRSPVVLLPDHPVTITVQKMIEKYYPEELRKRKEEMEQEVVFDTASLPLFPLKHVAFPQMTFPLHIFEPKYRLMIRRCMAGSKCFGLVNVHRNTADTNGSWIPYDIGCLVSINSIQTLIDGRSFVQCKGTRRFRVLEKWEQDGYLMGKVQWIEEQPVMPSERAEYEATVGEVRTLVNLLLSGDRLFRDSAHELSSLLSQAGDIPDEDLDFSFWLSRFLPISPETRQSLLETTSTLDRFRALMMLFHETTKVAPAVFLQQMNYIDHEMAEAKLPGFFELTSQLSLPNQPTTNPATIPQPMLSRPTRTRSRPSPMSQTPTLPPITTNVPSQTTPNTTAGRGPWRWF